MFVCVCVQKQSIQVKSSAKDSRWYDVGIVKVTNMVVTHYYVPYDDNVIDVRQFYFSIQQGSNRAQTRFSQEERHLCSLILKAQELWDIQHDRDTTGRAGSEPHHLRVLTEWNMLIWFSVTSPYWGNHCFWYSSRINRSCRTSVRIFMFLSFLLYHSETVKLSEPPQINSSAV